MNILVVDFRQNRRLGVARLSGADVKNVFETCPNGIADIARPRLALWHVGYDQNTEECGSLRSQLNEFLDQEHSWVAAYTGGQVPHELLPNESDYFVVRPDGGADVFPGDQFKAAIERVAAHWTLSSGMFLPGHLHQEWGGRNVAQELLEADKLTFLMTLGAGKEVSPQLIQTLRQSYPALDSEIEAHRCGDAHALIRLRKLFSV